MPHPRHTKHLSYRSCASAHLDESARTPAPCCQQAPPVPCGPQPPRQRRSQAARTKVSLAMHKLIHFRLCPLSRAVRLALAELDIEAELVEERPWEWRPEFLAINPAGELPVLQIRGRPRLCGVYAISEYLAEAAPDQIPRSRLPRRLFPRHQGGARRGPPPRRLVQRQAQPRRDAGAAAREGLCARAAGRRPAPQCRHPARHPHQPALPYELH